MNDEISQGRPIMTYTIADNLSCGDIVVTTIYSLLIAFEGSLYSQTSFTAHTVNYSKASHGIKVRIHMRHSPSEVIGCVSYQY